MNVTLIHPPAVCRERFAAALAHVGLGILYVASALRAAGHRVTLIDGIAGASRITELPGGLFKAGLTDDEIVRLVPPDTGMIGLAAPFLHLAGPSHRLVAALKRAFPAVPLVLGGAYPSAVSRMAIASGADYVVLGEGEETMNALIDALARGGALPPGVITRDSPDEDHRPRFVRELDPLPLPARDLIDFARYLSPVSPRAAKIITSRGCPFDCEFCSVHPVCGRNFRPRDPRGVLAEIDGLIASYGIDSVTVEDDNFTLQRDRAVEILEGLIDRKISWDARNGLRIDTLTEDLMKVIARSDCRRINLALEHGDPEMLRIMNKRLDLDLVVDVVAMTRRLRIPTSVFILYGYPGETAARFDHALGFYKRLKRVNPDLDFLYFAVQPYPGTKLYERCIREGHLDRRDFEDPARMPTFYNDFLIETPDFDRRELARRRVALLRHLEPATYLRGKVKGMIPSVVLARLARWRDRLFGR